MCHTKEFKLILKVIFDAENLGRGESGWNGNRGLSQGDPLGDFAG